MNSLVYSLFAVYCQNRPLESTTNNSIHMQSLRNKLCQFTEIAIYIVSKECVLKVSKAMTALSIVSRHLVIAKGCYINLSLVISLFLLPLPSFLTLTMH